jgi:3'(2'), 5'-bisphosphate nucleotidase
MMTAPITLNPLAPDLASLHTILNIARAASNAIMGVYQSDFTVETKPDDSPLTVADKQAHQIIISALEQLTPTIPVLSEESPAEHHRPGVRQQWPTLWLVDPLDGTREFIKRNGEFTVNIALIHQQRSVLGVVAAPALNAAYLGARGLGAWRTTLDDADGHLELIHVRHLHKPPVVVGSRSHGGGSLDTLLARLGSHELRAVGSALKFCRVAEGSADLYPRLGPTSEWDTAAGQAILEAAGGHVLNLSGTPLRYNQRDTLLNPHFMALGDAAFDWQHLL